MQPYRTDEWSQVAANMATSVIGFGSFVDQLYRLQEQQVPSSSDCLPRCTKSDLGQTEKVIAEVVDAFLKNCSAVSGNGDYAPEKLWLMRALSRPFPPPPISNGLPQVFKLSCRVVSVARFLNLHQQPTTPAKGC
jgi:hypothetical protein